MRQVNNGNGRVSDRPAAESMLRALHEHSVDDPIERVRPLIHPDAEMRLLVSYGELVCGRDAIADALEHGPEAATFRARVEGFEWLDQSTSLTTGQARYP